MKRYGKKIVRVAAMCLCAALALALWTAAPASAADTPAGVTAWKDTIGGSAAELVTVTMSGRTGKMVLAGDSVVEDAKAADLVAQGGESVVAAINGGFFASYYSASSPRTFPDNCPQIFNTIVLDNKLVNAGGLKPVLGFEADGTPHIDKVGFRPYLRLESGFAPTSWGVNYVYDDPEAIMFFTDELTLPVTVPADATAYYIKDGKVIDVTAGGTFTVPEGTDVMVYNSAVAEVERGYNRLPRLGEQVEVFYQSSPRKEEDKALWDSMTTVVGGGPILLLDGEIATDQNSEFTDPKQQPDVKNQRSFVGITQQGDLVMGTVNATFNQIAAYLQKQGVRDAMAMDGGASSMLYAKGSGYLTSAGRKLASILTIVDTNAGTKPSAPTVAGFSDVYETNYYADAVVWAVENNVTTGTSKTTFSPSNTVTRAQAVTFLWRAAGKPEPTTTVSPFTDVTNPKDYYYKPVLWAVEKGITKGVSKTAFGPDGTLAYDQILTFLCRAAGGSAGGSNWSDKAVEWAAANGLTDGLTFTPKGNCPRSDVVYCLWKQLA